MAADGLKYDTLRKKGAFCYNERVKILQAAKVGDINATYLSSRLCETKFRPYKRQKQS
jgi:hypothetical protein